MLPVPPSPDTASAGELTLAWLTRLKAHVPGELSCHDGRFHHHQAQDLPAAAGDWRSTLEGHGIGRQRQWQLFR
jgi:hypothetical protein